MPSVRNLVVFLVLVLPGCSWLAPEQHNPPLEMPEAWPTAETEHTAAQAVLQQWWRNYQDPVLTDLIDEALAGNDDLAVAAARLRQAKAQYDYAAADRLPVLGLIGLSTRSQLDFSDSPLVSDNPATAQFGGGLLSYEVDLWGKAAGTQEAAAAAYRGQQCSRDAARLSVAASTAELYFSLLALDSSLEIMQELVRTQEKMHALTTRKFEVGAVPAISFKTSEAELAARTAELAKLSEQLDKTEAALATLIGRSPRQIVEGRLARGKGLADLPVPPVTPDDLPSALLTRRPDIAGLEQMLVASNINIGVARAAYFPTLSLSGLLGVTGLDIDRLYTGSVRTWTLGGSLAGPLIDFGRTGSGVDLATAKNQEQLARYKAGVRTAFKEVRNALSLQKNTQKAAAEQQRREAAVQEALLLVNQRYSLGFSSYPDVLAAERALQEARLAAVAARQNRLTASVEIFKALGGGWHIPDTPH